MTPRIAIPYLCPLVAACASNNQRSRRVSLALGLFLAGCGLGEPAPPAATSAVKAETCTCDEGPTGVATTNYALQFRAEGMPDPQYDGRPAKLEVHRVRPVYAHGKCANVPNRVAVLIHGRTTASRPNFDLRHGEDQGGELSLQEALASAGIDTFAPDLLGYGRSTRFGLDDPCNASRPDDFTNNAGIFPPDQQGRPATDTAGQPQATLVANPLEGVRCPHSSSVRFGKTDIWTRDIRQVIDDAILKGQPLDSKVTLIGFSFGAQRVGRALDAGRQPEGYDIYDKVNKAVFGAPLFYIGPNGAQPTRDEPNAPFASFPLVLSGFGRFGISPAGREAACPGRVVPGSEEEAFAQGLDLDEIGSQWGGSVVGEPTGLIRSPTFSTYGLNAEVAATIHVPTLVIQGLDDAGLPPTVIPPSAPGPDGHLQYHKHSCGLYNSLAAVENKVLVQLDCATHVLLVEGCAGDADRCQGHEGVTPYGGSPDAGWGGPHATFAAALIEWIKDGTFTIPGQAPRTSGKFLVDARGVASEQGSDGTPVYCQ